MVSKAGLFIIEIFFLNYGGPMYPFASTLNLSKHFSPFAYFFYRTLTTGTIGPVTVPCPWM